MVLFPFLLLSCAFLPGSFGVGSISFLHFFLPRGLFFLALKVQVFLAFLIGLRIFALGLLVGSGGWADEDGLAVSGFVVVQAFLVFVPPLVVQVHVHVFVFLGTPLSVELVVLVAVGRKFPGFAGERLVLVPFFCLLDGVRVAQLGRVGSEVALGMRFGSGSFLGSLNHDSWFLQLLLCNFTGFSGFFFGLSGQFVVFEGVDEFSEGGIGVVDIWEEQLGGQLEGCLYF